MLAFYRAMQGYGSGLAEAVTVPMSEYQDNRRKKMNYILYNGIMDTSSPLAFDDSTTVLTVNVVDSFSLAYTLQQNGKTTHQGVATLDNSSVPSFRHTVPNEKGEQRAAFRFTDEEEGCPVEILISKERYFGDEDAAVEVICRNEEKWKSGALRLRISE